jgi:hypothetical protein
MPKCVDRMDTRRPPWSSPALHKRLIRALKFVLDRSDPRKLESTLACQDIEDITKAAQPLPPIQPWTHHQFANAGFNVHVALYSRQPHKKCHSVSRFEQLRFQKKKKENNNRQGFSTADNAWIVIMLRDRTSSISSIGYTVHTAFPHAQNCARVMRIFSTSKLGR